MNDDEEWMQKALHQAKLAGQQGEVPVGAIVVKQGVMIASAGNEKESLCDPTAHAEVLALRKAAAIQATWRLTDVTLYVTQEPCLMCAGAILHARVSRLVYGCDNPKAGAVRTLYQVLEDDRLNHQVQVSKGVLAGTCSDLLHQFFERLRSTGKK